MAPTIRTHGFIFAVTLLLIPISLTWAADQTIILRLGAGATLLLERPFKTVLIGDPNIVDVLTQSDRSVIPQPLNLGATNIIFLDETSIAITNVRVLVYGTGASRINCQDVAEIDDRQASLLDKNPERCKRGRATFERPTHSKLAPILKTANAVRLTLPPALDFRYWHLASLRRAVE